MLLRNEIYFSPPDKFNDPFDCKIPIRFENGTKEQVLEAFCEVAINRNPELSKDEAVAEVKSEIGDYDHQSQASINEMRRLFAISFNRKMGIVSFGGSDRDILMWSHYADSHQGFCVGVNAVKLAEWTQKISEQDTNIRLVKVNYLDKMPNLDPFTQSEAEIFQANIVSKASQWAYENEYRLLGFDLSGIALELDAGIIEEVIVGTRMLASDRKNLVEIIRNRPDKIKLRQAELNDESFVLDLIDIPY